MSLYLIKHPERRGKKIAEQYIRQKTRRRKKGRWIRLGRQGSVSVCICDLIVKTERGGVTSKERKTSALQVQQGEGRAFPAPKGDN